MCNSKSRHSADETNGATIRVPAMFTSKNNSGGVDSDVYTTNEVECGGYREIQRNVLQKRFNDRLAISLKKCTQEQHCVC